MFRRAATSFAKLARGSVGVQAAAAVTVAAAASSAPTKIEPLTDKQLGKKPEWFQIAVRSLEDQLKKLSKYGWIESEEALNEALDVLQRVADIQNADIQWRLARVYVEKAAISHNEHEKKHLLHQAETHATQAINLEGAKGSAGAHKWAAIALAALDKLEKGKGHNGKILEHLEKATKLNPADPYAWSLLGSAHLEARNWDAAANAFRRAESVKTDFSSANHFGLGAALKGAGKKEEAKDALKKAYQLPPKYGRDGKARVEAVKLLTALKVPESEYRKLDLY